MKYSKLPQSKEYRVRCTVYITVQCSAPYTSNIVQKQLTEPFVLPAILKTSPNSLLIPISIIMIYDNNIRRKKNTNFYRLGCIRPMS